MPPTPPYKNDIKTINRQHKQSNFFITVKKGSSQGYWEIDYVNQIANFRYFFNQRLPTSSSTDKNSISISDHSDEYDTIVDFLKDSIFPHTKEILKDKKIIFSNKIFCDVPTCDKNAKILLSHTNPKKYLCNNHKSFKLL